MTSFRIYILILILTSGVFCVKKKNTLDKINFQETTHQIVNYKNSFIRICKPKNEGENGQRIQIFNNKLEIIDEIECLLPYPKVYINYDSIIIKYLIFASEENAFKGLFKYYENKYQMLGGLKIYYKYQTILGSELSESILFDNYTISDNNILFFESKRIVYKTKLNNIFLSNNGFYYYTIKDNIKIVKSIIPVNNQLYNKNIEDIINWGMYNSPVIFYPLYHCI